VKSASLFGPPPNHPLLPARQSPTRISFFFFLGLNSDADWESKNIASTKITKQNKQTTTNFKQKTKQIAHQQPER